MAEQVNCNIDIVENEYRRLLADFLLDCVLDHELEVADAAQIYEALKDVT